MADKHSFVVVAYSGWHTAAHALAVLNELGKDGEITIKDA